MVVPANTRCVSPTAHLFAARPKPYRFCSDEWIVTTFGFHSVSDVAAFPALATIFGAYSFVLMPIENGLRAEGKDWRITIL